MPTFRISIKNNEKLHGKIRLCINIYLKLMDVGYRHMPIKLTRTSYPKTIKSEQNVKIFRSEGIMRS
ncbi:hypothetical protein CN915_28115 [Bacillus cereus]|nr:hypothetical protein CN915_28115 [Bacillus cereus]PGN39628.1 hypothetical protein CN962_29800 [Bacillus cereus]